jgi:uncharacterized protein YgiM (DUF1202 family)
MNQGQVRMNCKRVVSILFIGLIFTFAACKKGEVVEAPKENAANSEKPAQPSAENTAYAFVTNPNGISLYQTALDLKSKVESIPFGGKIIFTSEVIDSQAEDVSNWSAVTYNGKKGYVYAIDSYTGKDWFQLYPLKANNEKTNQEEPGYSIVQTVKASLYELPSSDSKKVGEVDQYTLVNVLASGSQYDSFISNNIDLEMGAGERAWYEVAYGDKRGFVFNSVNYPVVKSAAEAMAKDKIISEKGYFALTTKEPTLYNSDTKEIFSKDYKIKVLKENAFLDTSESRLINGEQVYLIYLTDKVSVKLKKKPRKSEDDLTPYMAYISAKDGTYFTEEKFTNYTVANTKYKGDLNAISIMRSEFEKRGIYLNFVNFNLTKISSENYPKDSYFIASAMVGNESVEFNGSGGIRSIILKQTDGIYEPVSGSIYTSRPIQYKDLDKDGIMEMVVRTPTRGGDEAIIYGLKEGKYVSFSTILSQMGIYEIDIKGDKIKGKKWITSADGKDTKAEIHYFKYDHGNFVEVKK